MSIIKELSKHMPRKETVLLSLILLSLLVFSGCSGLNVLNKVNFEGYTLIEVDGGDLSGSGGPMWWWILVLVTASIMLLPTNMGN